MGFGRWAAPLVLGGDASPAEQTWLALRDAEGSHVGAEGSLEDEWRRCIATALAAADVAVERAMLQFFPAWADDMLEGYEKALGLLPPPTLTRTERRETAQARWTEKGRADLPSLEEELQARFGPDWTVELSSGVVSTLPGRWFSPAGLEATEPRTFPNFSSAYFVIARTDGPWDEATRVAVAEFLDGRAPAWCIPVVHQGAGPFTLGTGILGVTPL